MFNSFHQLISDGVILLLMAKQGVHSRLSDNRNPLPAPAESDSMRTMREPQQQFHSKQLYNKLTVHQGWKNLGTLHNQVMEVWKTHVTM